MRTGSIFAAILLIAAFPRFSLAEARVESNVIYGMYSGLALLMDVHYPANSNGYGIVLIPGSGWHAPLSLDAVPLKQSPSVRSILGADALLEGGYTLFSINHRAAGRFKYPAAVEDAQRAVRYIRHHAASYGIDPERIGATGHSTGGYLVSMLGVLDGDGNPVDSSSINQESSKVQAVIALSTSFDLIEFTRLVGSNASGTGFLGSPLRGPQLRNPQSEEFLLYMEASPTSYVSPDDPPFFLIHGDADSTVPFSQSELFQDKLTEIGVTVELIRVAGGGHGLSNSAGQSASDHFGRMAEWFDRHLQTEH